MSDLLHLIYFFLLNLAQTNLNKALLWATISVLGWMGLLPSASAQIRPDATLPINSEVRSEGAIQRILGGTQAGQNLFHSFRQFDLPPGTTVYFDQNPALTNIFARITGGQASSVDGVLRANGATNLFLINPKGILFGPNAQLNVGALFRYNSKSYPISEWQRFQHNAYRPVCTVVVH